MIKSEVLRSCTIGNPRAEDFVVETVPLPLPRDKEVLFRTPWLSLDPLVRFAIDQVRLTGRTHLNIGDVIYGGKVAVELADP